MAALCHLLHGGVRVPNTEEVFERVLDTPEDDKSDIDDVLVTRQDHVPCPNGAQTAACGHADLDDVLPCHFRQMHLIDRIRQAEVQAGRLLARDFAEARDDAKLIGIHAEGKSKGGDGSRQYDGQDQGDPAG
jgi:hypothetical protein